MDNSSQRLHKPKKISKKVNKKKRTKNQRTEPHAEYPKKSKITVDKQKRIAHEYLTQWNTDRPNWKFAKLNQIWLIDNCLKKGMLGKHSFETFLSYIADMKGISRQRCLEKAQAIVSNKEKRAESGESKDKESSAKLKRAKKIVQVLE